MYDQEEAPGSSTGLKGKTQAAAITPIAIAHSSSSGVEQSSRSEDAGSSAGRGRKSTKGKKGASRGKPWDGVPSGPQSRQRGGGRAGGSKRGGKARMHGASAQGALAEQGRQAESF
jgi:hypothetical protein